MMVPALMALGIAAAAVAIVTNATGCTENERARAHGGSMVVKLECGQKLFDVTWKEASFWYATRPMHGDEEPESYSFKEKSPLGVVQGSVSLIECK